MVRVDRAQTRRYGSMAGWEGYPYHLPDKLLPLGKVSYEEFLDWADEDTHAEWVDGEIMMTGPEDYRHQAIKGFLESIMGVYNDAFELGTVISGEFQMKLSKSGRAPDIMFIRKEHSDRIQPNLLNGPADLVIEIVSPESQERDWKTKFQEYSENGVPEYWIIDPTQNQAEFYYLDKNNEYLRRTSGAYDDDNKVVSLTMNPLWINPEWLWQTPLPEVNQVLLEIGGTVYAQYLINQLKQSGFLPPDA